MILNQFRYLTLALCVVLASCAKPPVTDVDSGDTEPEKDQGGTIPGRPSVSLRVATFNTGRFFDTVCDSNNCDDSGDFERQLSPAEFDRKVEQMVTAVNTLDADIIALQEVENADCLNALVAGAPQYTFAEIGEIGLTASLDVAVLSRLTHLGTRVHRANTPLPMPNNRTQQFAREFMEVHFNRAGKRVVMLAAHFKARRNDDPDWRLAEATAARQIADNIQAEFPEALVILGGDLNDNPGTPPLDALLAGGQMRLATEDLPAEEIWTYSYFADRIAIDHLIYSWNGVAEVVSAGVVRDASGTTFAGSDHAALRAEFAIWTD